jgi:hypothetical protein
MRPFELNASYLDKFNDSICSPVRKRLRYLSNREAISIWLERPHGCREAFRPIESRRGASRLSFVSPVKLAFALDQ